MSNILLLGSGGNAGINFTKCLKKSGHTIFGADMNKYYLAAGNVDVKLRIDYSSEQAKVNSIARGVNKFAIDMIHAQPDVEVEFLLKHKYVFQSKIFPHSLDTWQRFANKLLCQNIWSRKIKVFMAYPYKDILQYPHLFDSLLERGGGKAWIRAIKGAGSKGALPIQTIEQGKNWVAYWKEVRNIPNSDFMVCQFLPGKEYAVQTFWLNGELVHSQARERMVYFFGALMPSGQTSTPSVACTVDNKKVYQTAYNSIKAIDQKPHGIYCVDLKEDVDGDPIPMEVNYGRFFTTSDFFSYIGINSPLEYVNSFTQKGYIPSPKIETIKETLYWIRGLDKEPKLVRNV